MRNIFIQLATATGIITMLSCNQPSRQEEQKSQETKPEVEIIADRFADLQILRYAIPGFEELSLRQKQLAYYLYMAGMSGRDIFFDQKYRYNLQIRKTIETILETYQGDKNDSNYKSFVIYAKQFFFSNGIHHHYSADKIIPGFSPDYLATLLSNSDFSKVPSEGKSVSEFVEFLTPVLFDPAVDGKCVSLAANTDNVKASANNLYEGVTQKEVEDYYQSKTIHGVKEQPAWGLNTKVVKENGKVTEKVWKSGGMYGAAIDQIVFWLDKAATVAENEIQKQTIEALSKYYKSGDLKDYDDYCILWVKDTASRIDFANGFIEVYLDPMHRKGAYEAVLSMKDLEATKRIDAIAKQAQWFEDNSSILPEHKKKNVTGISAKVITVINECGDAAPSTPIGINLPNQEWIRETAGSKSVSLGNIVESYNFAKAKSPMIDEFGESAEVIERVKKYGALAADLHTDMHEVIGHASGVINKGVASPDITLKNYASTLEEARADLVALYFITDQKLVDLGVMPTTDVGRAEYDSYILNGLMTQLYRIKPGDNLEESHMRNRQLVAGWVFEKGKADSVIERISRNGKTYFRINDYSKLRTLFGNLLREIQRIKSEGDFEAGKNLVEDYGVIVDQQLLNEVHERFKPLNIAPYSGFIQPELIPVMDGENITDVKVVYNQDFLTQMLEYGKKFAFLPVRN
ncbi:MAG: dipeptidyl peptidase 3 [Bacteroidia bacterium]|nr:dihydrofolate reductase [Bacteroidia bacterium]MCZ2276831.1 dipeptidyl peptidase 3 [Bacteroidia bacterium]